jgi:hypothetical protein
VPNAGGLLSALSNNAKTGRGPRLAPRPPSESDNIYYSEKDLSSNFRDRRLVAVAPVREPRPKRWALWHPSTPLRAGFEVVPFQDSSRSGQALKSCASTKKTAGPRSTPPGLRSRSLRAGSPLRCAPAGMTSRLPRVGVPRLREDLARAQDQASLGMTGCGQWSV